MSAYEADMLSEEHKRLMLMLVAIYKCTKCSNFLCLKDGVESVESVLLGANYREKEDCS